MKKLLLVVGAVIVVLILVVLLAPFFISADSLKGQILAQVQSATGRQMTIAGPLSLGFFPNVKVKATGVTLANPPGAQTPAMAQVKQVDIAVRLLPLLSGQVDVERLSLVNPQIALEIDPQGRPSWSFAESGASLPAPAPGVAPPRNAPIMGLAALSRLRVKDVSIENGDIVFLDRRTNRHYELQQVTLTVSAPNLEAPATVDGSAMWRGQKVTFALKLDRTGALMASGGKTNLAASLTAKAIVAKLAGAVANDNAVLAFDGKVDLSVPSVRDLVTWSGVPIDLPKHGFGALAMSGAVHAENGVAKFSNGSFALDGIKATGALTLDATRAKPNITGQLAAGMVDVNPYLPPPVPGWHSDPFDTAMLREVDADLTIDAAGAKYRKMSIGKSTAAVHLKDGKLTLDVSDITMYRGSGKGTVTVDVTGDAAAVNVNGSMSGVEIGPLLRDAGGGGSVDGSGSFTVSATARGNSERDLVGTLTGKSSFRVSGGSLSGVDLGGMLKNTASAFSGGGATTIERASGNFAIRNGIMTNRDLSVSTSSIDATGSGTVNLPGRSLNFRIEPKLMAGIVTVPVTVSGPWDHVSYTPDLAGIAKGIVTAPVNAIGDAAGGVSKVGQGVGGAIKSLFGN